MHRERHPSVRAWKDWFTWATLSLWLWAAPVAANVFYHWTDENGVRHYANTRPPEGVDASVVMEEIPYDPESDVQRRDGEDRLLEERREAQIEERLKKAEEEAEAARREAEAARRKAERLEDELEARDEDRSYGIYYRKPHRPPPGHRPPGHRPPGHRPPGAERPDDRPSWYPPYNPFPTYPDKPWQQPRRRAEKEGHRGDGHRPPPRR